MKKFALIALLGLISFTEAIHLSEDPAPAGDAEPKEDAKAPAPPTEEEKKEAAKKVEDAKAEQEAIDKKAAKAAKKEDEVKVGVLLLNLGGPEKTDDVEGKKLLLNSIYILKKRMMIKQS